MATTESLTYHVDYSGRSGKYLFSDSFITDDSIIYFDAVKYVVERLSENSFIARSGHNSIYILELDEGYLFVFNKSYSSIENYPEVKVVSVAEEGEGQPALGRVIQLLKFDEMNVQDFYLLNGYDLLYSDDYSNDRLFDIITDGLSHTDDMFLFKNWQYIDTGYRDDSLERNKRFRELQLQLNNIEGADLNFGFSFILDGQERYSFYRYETEHIIDENDPNYGLIYILGSPYMNLNMDRLETPNETVLGDDINAWTLNQSMFPEVSLWKIRAHVSGKGAAPRMKLLSRNVNRFELMNINWVCRYMNTR